MWVLSWEDIVRLNSPPPESIGADVADTAHIVVPYVAGMLHRETVTRVVISGRAYRFVEVDPADPHHYARIFASWWNRGSDLVILEQDMVPHFGWMLEFQSCPKPFCTHYYDCNALEKAYGLGCARFSAALQATVPSLGQQAAGTVGGRAPGTHWRALNERVIDLCRHFRAAPHIHPDDVEHLHDYAGEAADAGARTR